MQCGGYGFHLYLTRPFEMALLDDPPEFILKEEVAPPYAVGGLFGDVDLQFDLFVRAVLTELHRVYNCRLLI